MKTIGLIGGLSWESTAEYYRIINQEINRRLGEWHSAKIIMVSVDFQEHYQLHHDGQWERVADIMLEEARRVQGAGADLLLIATNTVHKVADTVEAGLDIPLIHIADAAARAIRSKGLQSVGLLGTKFTMTEPFYKDRITEKHGLRVVTPAPRDAERINTIIYEELVKGRIEESIPPRRSGGHRRFEGPRRGRRNPGLYGAAVTDQAGPPGTAGLRHHRASRPGRRGRGFDRIVTRCRHDDSYPCIPGGKMNQELSLKHHHLAVDRLRGLMKDRELSALVAITNENFTYLNAQASAFSGIVPHAGSGHGGASFGW